MQHSLRMSNLAWLRAGGLELTQHYVQPSCAPTRSSLMTGRISNHLGTQNGGWHESDAAGLPLQETTLAENLRDAGYATAIFGKWHLGYYKREFLPTSRGFDRQEGYYNAQCDYFTHQTSQNSEYPDGYDWNSDCVPTPARKGIFSDYLLRDAAVSYLRARAANASGVTQPWFLYLPMQAVHAPLQVPPQYLDLYPMLPKGSKRRIKAGMLSALDDALGAVLGALNSSAEMANRTLTLFTSDNGAQQHFGGSNVPYRGWKHELFEGGIRTPTIVHSAGAALLPPALRGTAHDGFFHVSDWLPTLVGLAGGNTSRNRPLDGLNIWQSLLRGTGSPRTELFHCDVDPRVPRTSMQGPHTALRVGPLKLLQWPNGTNAVFNVSADPEEAHDLSSHHSKQLLPPLLARLAYWRNQSVPAWVSDAACLPLLGPVRYNSTVSVWAPTCD